ncbi:hypothetical protein JTE90_013894 [Oedothorax gibbosus]|uniref:Gustatory receptor n=1 Tax=Oedothorax gibbosus TaxID=931172 RepID=A0AAV6VG26_9ARAC|nr:hypothetical protein JTE90_013894 [Oedothorax gibbosus]
MFSLLKSRNSFYFLFYVARFTGLPLPSSQPSQSKLESRNFNIFCLLLTILKTISFLFSCITIHHLVRATTLRLTFYSFNTCGTLTVFAIIAKKSSIRKTMKTLTQLRTELDFNCHVGSRQSIHLVIILASLVIIIFFAQIIFYFDKSHDDRWSVVKIYGLVLSNSTRRVYLDVYHCCVVFTYTNSTITVCLMSLVSYNVSNVLGDIIKSYRKRLMAILRHPNPTVDDIHVSVTLFRRIVCCTRDIEHALSLCLLLLYGASVTWIFNSFNVVIVRDKVYHNKLAYAFVAITTAMALIVFFTVTQGASRLISEDKKLKCLTVRLAERPFTASYASSFCVCNLSTLHCIKLLMRSIRGNRIYLTAGNMFILQRSLVLTMFGLISSYGVLLHQFGDYQL